MARGEVDEQSVILAAGGIISRQSPEGTEVLVVHRFRYDDWCLPKGKLEGNELFEEAALREVEEETGYGAHIKDFAGCVCYRVKGKQKVVLFWNMEAVSECAFKPSDEVKETRWFSVKSAKKIMNYPLEKKLLTKVFDKS